MLFVAGGVVVAAVALLLLLLLLVVVVVVVMLNYQPIKELQLSAAQEKEYNLLRSFFLIFVGFTVLILLFLYRESVVSIYQLNELSHI